MPGRVRCQMGGAASRSCWAECTACPVTRPLCHPTTHAIHANHTFLPTANKNPLMPKHAPNPTVATSLLMWRMVSYSARQGTTCVWCAGMMMMMTRCAPNLATGAVDVQLQVLFVFAVQVEHGCYQLVAQLLIDGLAEKDDALPVLLLGMKRVWLRPNRRVQIARTRQFRMSTHCQTFSRGVRYGTRGTPIGIMRVTCLRAPPVLRTDNDCCVA